MLGRARIPFVAGIDGARGGWFVVLKNLLTGGVNTRLLRRIEEALALPENPKILAVDMPIGLLRRAERGGRACDRETRRLLGHPRQTSVFSPPVRQALRALSYRSALRLNRASSHAQIGVSIHCYGLFTKLRELDRLVSPELQGKLKEAHPELCFSQMNGSPLREPKRSAVGRELRRNLLAQAGFGRVRFPAGCRRSEVSMDDVLDAHALCWMAEQIYYKRVRPVPGEPIPRDERGLKMEIWGNRVEPCL
jgi:predicted RNase H-like nuclease